MPNFDSFRRGSWTLVGLLAATSMLHAQDTGVGPRDGGGGAALESIYVPNFPNAPFTLSLHTEWIHSMANGGTFTEANQRPILRDTQGRIYMERWVLVPKGSDVKSVMTTIQLDDPVAGKFYQCYVFAKVCEIRNAFRGLAHYDPSHLSSGPLSNGKGSFQHEELGRTNIAGVSVLGYRDTTTLDAGAFGNDVRMITVREIQYSPELGFNLSSILDAAPVGRQVFTVTEITLGEPDPHFFQPPEGYKLIDKRKPPAAQTTPSQP